MPEIFRRTADLSRSSIDEKARTISLSFSSEYPVDRGEEIEVLSHRDGDMNLSRLSDGHPLLMNHNTNQHVGSVQKVWNDGVKGRAVVKISRSAKGEELLQDIKDGITKYILVGYERTRELSRKAVDGGRALIRYAWSPYEISIVPVPADPTVGIGRSKPRITMNAENENQNYDEGQQLSRRERRSGLDADYRSKNINSAVDMIAPNHPELVGEFRHMASEAVLRGTSQEDFNASLLARIQRNPPKRELYDAGVGMDDREIGRYSFTRAFQSILRTGKLEGFEADISRQYERTSGQSAEGFWIPPDVLRGPTSGKRDMSVTTFGQGGAFVQTTVLTSPIEILRNRMCVMRLGAQQMGGLQGNVSIPRQTGAATVYSLPESAALTVANQALDQVPLSPKRVGAVGKYLKQLLLQSSVDVENFIRADLMAQCSIKLDYLAIAGSGAGSEPVGIINQTGVGSVTFGAAASYAKLVAFETSLGSANADLGKLAYLTTPATKGKLKLKPKIGDTFPVFCWEKPEVDDGTNDGLVNDYRAASTNQIAGDLVIFGNWSDLITAMWGGFDVVVNPYTFDVNAQVQITVNIFCDVALRHAASFCVSSDSGAQ